MGKKSRKKKEKREIKKIDNDKTFRKRLDGNGVSGRKTSLEIFCLFIIR